MNFLRFLGLRKQFTKMHTIAPLSLSLSRAPGRGKSVFLPSTEYNLLRLAAYAPAACKWARFYEHYPSDAVNFFIPSARNAKGRTKPGSLG